MALQKVILDTCVIESAVRSRLGASFQILQQINAGKFRFGISTSLFLEYESRLRLCKAQESISVSGPGLQAILSALAYYGDEVPIYYRLRPNLKDVNDDMVFECCVNYSADYLVTFNVRDFLRGELKGYSFAVITPKQFLTEVMDP
ncbi:MAG: putative toxin-antitoxin system toxin component, PIN family [Gemmatimonadetes bacterium]|jgi:putative PIN family toxin of toxin-antitoxin system|nr:putative toxin-antitoxin system toxin component, PIN family [Gemmatimonadota bacterium]MBT7915213.1 putative toxin-antitoxin system toxin component, PIN family [Candidatus Bathyarchaeota archaeon]